MSHRKVHSQGSVPFSWEDRPGVSKVTHQKCPASVGTNALNLPLPPPPPLLAPSHSPSLVSIQHVKIPLPPCIAQPLHRSGSSKGLRGQEEEDPFLAAYRECTKSVENTKKPKKSKKGFELGRRKWGFSLSCKNSCEVEDDSFMRLTHLPPLPKERANVRGFRWD